MKKHTKWIALTDYEYDSNQYLILARGNMKTGMLQFKIKRLNLIFTCCHKSLGLNIEDGWEKLQQAIIGEK